jgi:hypothetical protein
VCVDRCFHSSLWCGFSINWLLLSTAAYGWQGELWCLMMLEGDGSCSRWKIRALPIAEVQFVTVFIPEPQCCSRWTCWKPERLKPHLKNTLLREIILAYVSLFAILKTKGWWFVVFGSWFVVLFQSEFSSTSADLGFEPLQGPRITCQWTPAMILMAVSLLWSPVAAATGVSRGVVVQIIMHK